MKWFNNKIRNVKWFSFWKIRTGEYDESDEDEINTPKTPLKIQNPMPTKAQPKVNVRDLSSLMKAALNTLNTQKQVNN